MSATIVSDRQIISAARALSDSAYDLGSEREAIDRFIAKGNDVYDVLQAIELKPDFLLTPSTITLLEFTSRSLHFLRDSISERQSFTEVLPIINKILPELDGLLTTAIVALDPRIWESLDAINRGDRRGITFESLEDAAKYFGIDQSLEEANTHLAD